MAAPAAFRLPSSYSPAHSPSKAAAACRSKLSATACARRGRGRTRELAAPALDGFCHLTERAALPRELVRYADGWAGLDLALDDAARFENFEPRREHLGAETRRGLAELTKTARTVLERGQYHRCPGPAQDLDGALKRPALAIDAF